MPEERTDAMRVAAEGIDGVGKSTVLAHVRRLLAQRHSVLVDTMAPVTLGLLKGFGRDVLGAPQAYWTAVSRRTKTQVFLTEGVVRAEYLRDHHNSFDVVLYDRWWQTYLAYSDGDDEFDGRCRFLRDRLPALDVVFLFRGDPAVCADRLIADGDWLAGQMPASRLPGFLGDLQSRYDEIFRGDARCVVIDTAGRGPEELAHEVVNHLESMLPEHGAGGPRAHARRTTNGPAASIIAIEGVDGAGKSTLARAVADSLPGMVGLRRLASASLRMFKEHAGRDGSEDPSIAIRTQFEDEFRQQTYLIDGLVQLACVEGDAGIPKILLFDRWFPLFALYQDQITSDRGLFDYLLSRFPIPDRVFYIDVPAETALARLAGRDDWMPRMLGAEGTRNALRDMAERHHRVLAEHPHAVTFLDGRQPVAVLADRVRTEIGA
ncbi:MAG: hypothetical protein IRZ07_01560 [Microbispora sp.]|nr:hypothetical protein [Microbispora sp.]